MSLALILALAMILDAALGEPRQLWSRVSHPTVVMGHLIGAADARFNHGPFRQIKGAVTLAALVLGAWIAGWLIAQLGGVVTAIAAAILLSHRSLVEHVEAVARALRQSLAEGRRAVAQIAGRDTAQMDQADISRAAIESAARNVSDEVIAPVFWFLIAGLPGMLVYKMVNTADSMIGDRTPRHVEFGRAAARFDDLLNLAPSRLTALMIWTLHPPRGDWSDIATDAAKHRSPNAGWPEAAMARAIDTALSGPRSCNGTREEFSFVHPRGTQDAGPAQILAATSVLWRLWASMLAALLVLAVLL